MTDNMELWNKVCKTDPKYTKTVTFGRSFTAIDPMYQVMKATEALGVAGRGWGFELIDKTFLPTDFIALTVRVWTGERANYIDHIGMCGLYMDKKKTLADGECVKKAMTDGITKGLSFFGFSADVFLGKFDDNKYVEERKQEEAVKKEPPEAKVLYDKHIIKLADQKQKEEFTQWWNDPTTKHDRERLKTLSREKFNALVTAMQIKCKEFKTDD